MPVPFFLLAMLVPIAQEPAPQSPAIVVTAHPWAPFISPMGEPYRAHTPTDDTLADWFYRTDKNRDGVLTVDEMEADAAQFFAKLDTDHDGEIGPDEIARYEDEIAPEIQVMSKTKRTPGQPAPVAAARAGDDDGLMDDDQDRDRRRSRSDEVDASLAIAGALQGAARYSLLNLPEPVVAADSDFNRSVTLEEFKQAAVERFQLLDSARHGKITLAQLEAMPHAPKSDGGHRKRNENAADMRIGNPLPPGP